MYATSILTVAIAAGLAAAAPLEGRAIARLQAGTPSWDIVLDSSSVSVNDMKNAPGKVIDIDLFDSTKDGKTTIKELAKTKQVICYFSAGSREDWRDDAKDFHQEDYGQEMDGWKGENWLNVKSNNVRAIMKKRIEKAAKAGCNAIDPDNVDGFNDNQDGFGYSKSAYSDYVNYLAGLAHSNGMAIGLKNALDIIPDVLPNIQFAVNEQCREYGECGKYKPVTKAGLAVFSIEYGNDDCSAPSGVKLTTVIKSEDQNLNSVGGQCNA